MKLEIGIAGTGEWGGNGFALDECGHDVSVWNRSSQKLSRLLKRVRKFNRPREMAAASDDHTI